MFYAWLFQEAIYAKHPQPSNPTGAKPASQEIDEGFTNSEVLQKLTLFRKTIANRHRNEDLLKKLQIHPLYDAAHHPQRKIERKDKAALPVNRVDFNLVPVSDADKNIINELNSNKLPEFKPLLPDIATEMKLLENYINNINKDYEEYYNDDNLYDDYMQSNTMTSYLIEKIQELHDWITKDPDFDQANTITTKVSTKSGFSELLRAVNDSLLEGNVTIVMNKLRDMYFGDNVTSGNSSRRIILTNSTDLLSFSILTLDVLLLHNIQLMAWESQEAARAKMLRDPDVFAFNALFMEHGQAGAG
ncbi:Uncharacterized protein OBRU01_24659 [Operophtera brumata]|uniref:Uncharacterized protein n=1 Tax=Operophtera brumata TaxID=104452 RepID=A0A0L7KLM8_OPEBR|nr:Uncharacterized protein OBRU01_24659 [Operophtera brumata]